MHLSTALTAVLLAAPALADLGADIRQQFQEGLAAEVEAAREHALAQAHAIPPQARRDLEPRAGETGYPPYKTDCPADKSWVRGARDGLNAQEADFLQRRSATIDAAVSKMLSASGMQAPPRQPRLGLALSGGGYRAMINGLGMTMATRGDNEEAASAGIGGWMDAMSYMAGLSGGSWATGTYMANGAPMPTDLVKNTWELASNLVFPEDGKVSFYSDMLKNVRAKSAEGFPTQITDYWALALGEHLLPVENRMDTNPNMTFDSLTTRISNLADASVPLPIIIAAEREKGEYVIGDNATVWEFTPYEFGSWAVGSPNKTYGFFSPVEYLGTSMNNAQPNGTCYKGFDQLTYVMGTSSTLFNAALLQINETDAGILGSAVQGILNDVSDQLNDVSQIPNPFKGYTGAENPLTDFEYLTLLDAGETNQNIPIEPLIVGPRGVDAIIAFDNSADTTYSWPNGSALWTTYNRALKFVEQQGVEHIRMPKVPSTNGFVNGGLNQRPVFFGCNGTDGADALDVPLIIYVPNYPWSYYSNSTTFTLAYENDTAIAQMESTMRAFTLNGTVPSWPKCLACALTDRAFSYTNANRTQECAECFDTWCWNGEDNDAAPDGDYQPGAGVTPSFIVEKNLSNSVQTSAITTTGNAASRRFETAGVAVAAVGSAFVSAVVGAAFLL